MTKNGTNGLSSGQKVFLGVVGMLVADSIITNIRRIKAQKNYVNMVNRMRDSSSEEKDKK